MCNCKICKRELAAMAEALRRIKRMEIERDIADRRGRWVLKPWNQKRKDHHA